MCARYQLFTQEIRWLEKIARNAAAARTTECRPSGIGPAIIITHTEAETQSIQWGWEWQNGLLVNARAETALEKPTFQTAATTHRCLIPASCFAERDHGRRQLHYYRSITGEPLTLGGLWRRERGQTKFVILTQPANSLIKQVHDRMPLIIPTPNRKAWLEQAPCENLLNLGINSERRLQQCN